MTEGKQQIIDLLNPSQVESLLGRLPTGELNFMVYERIGDAPKPLLVKSIFPFMTLADMKLAIYVAMGMDDKALPSYTFIGKPVLPGKRLTPLEFSWSISTAPNEIVGLASPFELASRPEVDGRFVEQSGERRILGIVSRERMTIEDMFLKKTNRVPILHVYFYEDVAAAIPGEKPIGQREWNGRLYPYFPFLSAEHYEPTEEERADAQRRVRGFARRKEFFGKLEKLINEGEPLVPLTMTGVRFLRLVYTKPLTPIPGIDALFYEMPVTPRRPYMRLLPAIGSAISKIHMVGNRPNLEDPRLLLQWAQEKNPTPERDFALAKVLLRKASGNISPLYFTLRLLDDGSADITVDPPRGVRNLDPRSELDEFPQILGEALQGFPYGAPSLANGMFVFALNLKGSIPFTTGSIRAKLPIFSPVFQEIPPLLGERPLIMLRYKLVSNFTTEDTVQTFITQVMNRKLIRGDAIYTDLVELVANEFEMNLEEAKKRIADKFRASSEVVTVNPGEYALNTNPGVDIGIFQNHPFYSFHMYRVEGQETLERCITFISMLFSLSEKRIAVPVEAVREILRSELHAEADAEAEALNTFENVADDAFENVGEEDLAVAPKEEVAAAAEVASAAAMPDEYDGLMFDIAEGATLEEEEVARNAEGREIAKQFQNEAVEENVAAAAPAPAPAKFQIKKRVLAPAQAPAAAPAAEDAPEEKGFEKYFSDKLKEADRRLFDFHKTHPSLKKYVSQCGSNLMRQPAVLSQEKYERMLDEYKDVLDSDPPQIVFYVFPLDKDSKKEPYLPGRDTEYYTLMRYGTSEKNQNYYMCCRFFCVRDEIMVREKEFLGTVLRRPVKLADGTERYSKAPKTCPFCEGGLIVNRRFPGANQTVMERNVKAGTTDSRHLFIRFLKKTNHPEGFYLPCCFLEDQPLRIGHPAYPEPTREVPVGEEEIIETSEGDLVSYEEVLFKAKFAYIVGSEKLPLEGAVKKIQKVQKGTEIARGPPRLSVPQIGLLPPSLNEYFSQDSVELVSRTFNPQKLKAGSQGFLRVGVENRERYKNDSFLAAVAPFFGKASAKAFKTYLADIIQPIIFTGLNYGNLLLEMAQYKPGAKRPAVNEELKIWAKTNLHIRKITTGNEELVIRIYMAYQAFQEWLASEETEKGYRHFAHLFMQPGLLQTGLKRASVEGAAAQEYRRPGVVFIVLDMLKSGEIKVRCPSYPMNKDLFSKSDVGFLFHHFSGIWEPIFYVDNRNPEERDVTTFFLLFANSQYSRWPPIVQKRLEEFTSQCVSKAGGRGIYASASIPSTKIIGRTALKQQLATDDTLVYDGIIRDTYNHIAALVYKVPGKPLFVAVPAVDDGLSISDTTGHLILDWDDFEPAPIKDVVEFYARYIVPRWPSQYQIMHAVLSKGTRQIEAVQLANGLFVPVASTPSVPADIVLPESPIEIDEMEWSINRKLALGYRDGEEPPGEETRLRIKEFNEVYEHLRLTFSNWIHTKEEGGVIREDLERTIFRRDLPLFEKRKRLEIMLAADIESWIMESDEDAVRQSSLLRVDCRLRPKSECSGMCAWKQSGDAIERGTCLLHVHQTAPQEDSASAGRVLLLRLIEELIRFAGKRQQIFDKRVSQLAILENPIREKDQYIIPEKSSAWTELLRLEWSRDTVDKPIYLEEMTRAANTGSTGTVPVPSETEVSAIPPRLRTVLGDDAIVGRLRLYPSPTGRMDPFLATLQTSATAIRLEGNELTDISISSLVKQCKMPVVQIDLRVDPPAILAKQPVRNIGLAYPVFVIRDDLPPSLLVTDPENPVVLQREDLPNGLRRIIDESKKLFMKAE